QHMDGAASATTNATIWEAAGNVAVSAAALGNGGTAIATDDSTIDVQSTQLSHGDASAEVRFRGAYSANTATSASASGNTAAISLDDSGLRLFSEQESTGSTRASIEADHGGAGQAVSGAIASANNMSDGARDGLRSEEHTSELQSR